MERQVSVTVAYPIMFDMIIDDEKDNDVIETEIFIEANDLFKEITGINIDKNSDVEPVIIEIEAEDGQPVDFTW